MILKNNNHLFNKKGNNNKKFDKNNSNIIKKHKAEYIPNKVRDSIINKKEQSDSDNLGKSYDKIVFIKKRNIYVKNKQKIISPKKGQSNDLNYVSNTLENRTFTNHTIIDYNKYKYKTISPIKIITLKNNNICNNKNEIINYNNKKAQNKNNNNNNYSTEYSKLKNKYLSNNRFLFYNINNNRSKKIIVQKKGLNMFQKKMITISVQIIDRNILKHEKNSILNQFFTNLKKISSSKKDSNIKENNDNKDNLYNSVKTNNFLIENNTNESTNENNIINEAKNNKDDKNEEEINSKKNGTTRTKKDDIKRLKELEKKYEKFYEKKKNSNISLDDKYRHYCLQKYKTNYFNFPKIFKTALNKPDDSKTKNEMTGITEKPKENNLPNILNIPVTISSTKPRNQVITKKLSINNLSNSVNLKNLDSYFEPKTEGNSINGYNEAPKIYSNKIIIKKLKITPKIRRSLSKEILDNKNKTIIITKDKRLYININAKNLYDNGMYKKNKIHHYDNNLLSISNNNINIFIDNTQNANNYSMKHPKLLSNIEEEEIDVKFNNIKSEEKKYYIFKEINK